MMFNNGAFVLRNNQMFGRMHQAVEVQGNSLVFRIMPDMVRYVSDQDADIPSNCEPIYQGWLHEVAKIGPIQVLSIDVSDEISDEQLYYVTQQYITPHVGEPGHTSRGRLNALLIVKDLIDPNYGQWHDYLDYLIERHKRE